MPRVTLPYHARCLCQQLALVLPHCCCKQSPSPQSCTTTSTTSSIDGQCTYELELESCRAALHVKHYPIGQSTLHPHLQNVAVQVWNQAKQAVRFTRLTNKSIGHHWFLNHLPYRPLEGYPCGSEDHRPLQHSWRGQQQQRPRQPHQCWKGDALCNQHCTPQPGESVLLLLLVHRHHYTVQPEILTSCVPLCGAHILDILQATVRCACLLQVQHLRLESFTRIGSSRWHSMCVDTAPKGLQPCVPLLSYIFVILITLVVVCWCR